MSASVRGEDAGFVKEGADSLLFVYSVVPYLTGNVVTSRSPTGCALHAKGCVTESVLSGWFTHSFHSSSIRSPFESSYMQSSEMNRRLGKGSQVIFTKRKPKTDTDRSTGTADVRTETQNHRNAEHRQTLAFPEIDTDTRKGIVIR